jgi:hypothetical protein
MEFFTNASTYGRVGKCIVKLRFSIRSYLIAVVFVAEFVSLYRLIPWAIRAYQP